MNNFESDISRIITPREVLQRQAERARERRELRFDERQRERCEIAAKYPGSFLVRNSQASKAVFVACAMPDGAPFRFAVHCHTHGFVTYVLTRTGVDDKIREPVCVECRKIAAERFGYEW